MLQKQTANLMGPHTRTHRHTQREGRKTPLRLDQRSHCGTPQTVPVAPENSRAVSPIEIDETAGKRETQSMDEIAEKRKKQRGWWMRWQRGQLDKEQRPSVDQHSVLPIDGWEGVDGSRRAKGENAHSIDGSIDGDQTRTEQSELIDRDMIEKRDKDGRKDEQRDGDEQDAKRKRWRLFHREFKQEPHREHFHRVRRWHRVELLVEQPCKARKWAIFSAEKKKNKLQMTKSAFQEKKEKTAK
jgi:hypothetical protein